MRSQILLNALFLLGFAPGCTTLSQPVLLTGAEVRNRTDHDIRQSRDNRSMVEVVPAKESIRGRVHPNVYPRFDRFYRCPACGTVFWHGSHVRNTCRKLGLARPGE